MKYKILPLFIPHKGCPHKCIFCDQNKITGDHDEISIRKITGQIDAFSSIQKYSNTTDIYKEVAFFGGNFTGLANNLQISLLEPAYKVFIKGKINGIRISTRPDYCSSDALRLLKEYSVKTVELGVQSMDPEVLRLSGRGHGPEESIKAINTLKSGGFLTGVQLMAGLPGEDKDSFFSTIHKIISLKPDFIRLYPTIVLKDTALEKLYGQGLYKPLSLAKAIRLCSEGIRLFGAGGISVIRCGLQPTPSLEKKGAISAGPFHPAFGELVESALIYNLVNKGIKRFIGSVETKSEIFIKSSTESLSKLKGQKSANLYKLKKGYPDLKIFILPDPIIPYKSIRISNEKGDYLNINLPG